MSLNPFRYMTEDESNAFLRGWIRGTVVAYSIGLPIILCVYLWSRP